MSTGDVVPHWSADRLPARDPELRKARRSLFGPIDHRESEKFVRNELEKQYRLDQEKWNFDFSSEEPLNGSTKRYEWEPVVTPSMEDALETLKRGGSSNGGHPDAGDKRHLSQQHITDFMRKRKHASICSQKLSKTPVKSVRRSST